MKEIIDELDFIKIKNFCSVDGSVKTIRRQSTELRENICKDTSDKGGLSKTTKTKAKTLLKLNNKKTNNLITIMGQRH